MILAALSLVGCAPARRCVPLDVPMRWADGTVSMMHLQACGYATPRVVDGSAPR